MANNIDILINAKDNTGGALGSILSKITGISTQTLGMFTGALTAISAVTAYVSKSVKEFQDYATSVEDFARATGTSVENTSRLVSITDELGISYDKLLSAMKQATSGGYDISIGGLKELADEYVTLGNHVEKADFLVKVFGKSAGPDMAKLLEQGSAGIEKWNKGVTEAELITKKETEAVRKFKESQEELRDVQESLNNTVGLTAMEAWRTVLLGLDIVINGYSDDVEEATDIQRGFNYVNHTTTEEVEVAKKALEEQRAAIQDMYIEMDRAESAITDFELAWSKATKAQDKFDVSLNFVKSGLQSWGDELGPLGEQIWRGFLVGIGEITPAAAEEFARMQVLLENVRKMAAQGVAIPIIVQYITESFNGIQNSSNPPGPSATDWVLKGTKGGEGTSNAWWSPSLGQWYYGDRPPGFARGGSFIVPSGYPNDSYPIMVESGERVDVTPRGQQPSGSEIDYTRLGDEIVQALMRSGYVR
jgi:hypothetical protein